MANDKELAQHIRELGVGDIAHSMVQCTIARHGLRMAMAIIQDMQDRINEVVHVQQQRHPEDWPELKQQKQPAAPAVPPVPIAQPLQTEASKAKNTITIPQIPRVGG